MNSLELRRWSEHACGWVRGEGKKTDGEAAEQAMVNEILLGWLNGPGEILDGGNANERC